MTRYSHAATLLASGEVLVTGGAYGYDAGGLKPVAIASAELYDPATGAWRPAAPMYLPRYSHSATVLGGEGCAASPAPHCGDVVVAGGYYNGKIVESIDQHPTTSVEVYDRGLAPSTGTWRVTAAMSYLRSEHTATALPDGGAGGGRRDQLGRRRRRRGRGVRPHLDAGVARPVRHQDAERGRGQVLPRIGLRRHRGGGGVAAPRPGDVDVHRSLGRLPRLRGGCRRPARGQGDGGEGERGKIGPGLRV